MDWQQGLFTQNAEKSFIDKILGKSDIEHIRTLIKKPQLKREELLELLYMIGAVESKLLNYSEYDRYVILKFYVWLREFVKICEIFYDFRDKLEAHSKECRYCGLQETACECLFVVDDTKHHMFIPKMRLTDRTNLLLKDIESLIQHNAKFLIDLYLNIGRTTLSVKGIGFLEPLKNKYEMSYPSGMPGMQSQEDNNKMVWGKR